MCLLEDERKKYRVGMASVISSMTIWGFMPIYWQALIPIDSYVIILYRLVLAGLTCFIAALVTYGFAGIKEPLGDKKKLTKLILAGLVITANWSIYIYAINSYQVIETCIGYYIDPLMVCAFGIIFFGERPTKHKLIAIVFACLGVMIVLLHFMRFPLIALAIAMTFACYTAIKKHLKMKPLVSLLYETVFIAPFALTIIIYMEANGKGAFLAAQPYQLVLLAFAGVLTALPLALFAAAANRISMISIGIAGYVSPSINLIIGVFLFKEPFDHVQFIAFAVIWVGLVFFTYGEIKENR